MLNRVLPVTLILLASCEPSDPPFQLAMTMSPVIAQTAREALIVLFAADPDPNPCEVLRLSEKNTQDKMTLGTYRVPFTLDGTGPQSTEIFDLFPGRYQVAVFVYDGGKKLVGFGCQMQALTIEEGKQTETTMIEIRPSPG